MDCQYRNDMPPDKFSIGRPKACIFKIYRQVICPGFAQANQNQFTVHLRQTHLGPRHHGRLKEIHHDRTLDTTPHRFAPD